LYDPYGARITNEPRPQFEGRWPQPNRPLPAWYPHGAEPRQFWPWAGYNLTYMPRTEPGLALTPFQTLRLLADSCDLLRAALEHVKRQVIGLEWDIHPEDDVSQAKTSEITSVKAALQKPDGIHDFTTWLHMALEEMLVTDALTTYRWRTKAGDPLALLVLDGTTIKPLIDFHGLPPAPPEPAYQQVIMGRVETEFTRPWGDSEPFAPDGESKFEMSYQPRSPRAWSGYGQPVVERVLMTVNLILRRQVHYLSYYTAGSIPDAIYKVPQGWSVQQIKDYQEMWDAQFSGESEQRRHLRFVPGDKDSEMIQTKAGDAWTYEFEEFLGRVIAWHFGISPMAIAKMVNRASAERMDSAETDLAVRPLRKWIARVLIEPHIREFYGFEGLRFLWVDEKADDAKLLIDKHERYVKAGILSRSEVRDDLGMDAEPNDGSILTIDTATGPVPAILTEEDIPEEPTVPPGGSAAAALPGPGGAAHTGAEGSRSPSEGSPRPKEAEKAVAVELKNWRKVALKRVVAGKRPRLFVTKAVPMTLTMAVNEWLEHARTREDVDWCFSVLRKSRRPLVAARRRIRLEKRMRHAVMEHFRSRAPHVASVVAKHYHPTMKIAKDDPPDQEIDDSMAWNVFAENVTGPLADAYLDAETLAEGETQLEGSFALTSEQAVKYAQGRAAELVGMRRLDSGELVPNPRAKWSVPQTTRDRLRAEIQDALKAGLTETELRKRIESDEIWNWRADMIARTEVALALNSGSTDVYKAAGVEQVIVIDGPGCLEDGHDDSEDGVDGEVWPVDKSYEYPLGHPNCRRGFRPAEAVEEGA